jgi:putative membrane protein
MPQPQLPFPLPADLASRVALGAFALCTAATLAGYATFGLHPELVARIPGAAAVYGPAFRFFGVGQVCAAGAALLLFLLRHGGSKWMAAFAALYALSLGSELLGTTFGVPFGAYSYTALLGPRWLGRVPLVIPLSWFVMTVPSYALALRALSGEGDGRRRVLLGSLVLVAWDLALDPAMSHATKYWVWGEAGAYYGMPLLNLLGWYLTGVVLMTALEALSAERWVARLPVRWLGAFYLVNLALPLGMSAAAGLWGAVAGTLAGLVAARLAAAALDPRIEHMSAEVAA